MAEDNKVPKEFSPFMGPDSLRALTHLMKKLFNNHTPRSYGFEDTEGSYYEGTVENWGSESLLESRKLYLNKPSLKNILIENTFDYYFDVKYSDFVNTYDQQSMLCAILKNDVLLSNRTYRIKFENASTFSVPRAMSSSDPNVIVDNFIMTLTPPTLVIVENGVATEHALKLTDVGFSTTVYFFHLGVDTQDFRGELVDGTMLTEPITDSMNGYPMIWMCVNVLKTLPDIGFEGNEYGEDEKPLLTIGTNGHDMSFVYPFMGLTDDEIDLNNVIIKVIPTDSSAFIISDNPEVNEQNYESVIKEIHFLIYDSPNTNPHTQPTFDYVVTYDSDFISMKLHKMNGYYWKFDKPVAGDYDYDGEGYSNRVYAYIEALAFEYNMVSGASPVEAFNLHMADEYEYPKEYLSLNTYAGAHVDVTSDYSDNGVNKKNGAIHNFGDFDGLPIYYGYNIDKTLHRAHVELFATRDELNNPYQKASDKPTAGVIIDSGVPQVDYNALTNDLPMTIKFVNQDPIHRRFWWTDPPVSKYNVLSEIVYIDKNHFGNARIFGQSDKKKFIYHGNRRFSLSKLGFDPELEYGRVYGITNDKSSYENNEESENPKPERTAARICDIPTAYSQITPIENLSPLFVLDRDYVRTETNYSSDDINAVVNLTFSEHLIHDGEQFIFNEEYTGNYVTLANAEYPNWINLITYVDLNDTDNVTFEYDISSITNHYEIGDLFSFYLGGTYVIGRVSGAEYGEVTAVEFLNEITGEYESTPTFEHNMLNSVFFTTSSLSFDTEAKSGEGTGLKITVSLDSTYYASLQRQIQGVLPKTYYFYMDNYGVLSIYEFNGSSFENAGQVTGLYEFVNAYDADRTKSVSDSDALIGNNTNNKSHVMEDYEVRVQDLVSTTIQKDQYNPQSTTDMSSYLNEDRFNCQDSYYVITNKNDGGTMATVTRFSNCSFGISDADLIYPDFGDLNLSKYYQKSCALKYKFDHDELHQASVAIYDPLMDEKKKVTQAAHDLNIINSSRPMTFKDIFVESEYTPSNIISSAGNLTMNVYAYNEYDNSKREAFITSMNSKTREELIGMITSLNENAMPLDYENTDYAYSKNMLIDYIVENMLYWGSDDVTYTNGPQSIYRKPDIKLMATYGTHVIDGNKPAGPAPTGDFVPVMNELNPSRYIDKSSSVKTEPTFIFRLDGDNINPDLLNNFRMYDGDIDITMETLLIINCKKYIATISNDTIKWIRVGHEEGGND